MFLRRVDTGTWRLTCTQFCFSSPGLHGRKPFSVLTPLSFNLSKGPWWKENALVQTFDVYIWVNRIKVHTYRFSPNPLTSGSLHHESCDLTSVRSSSVTTRYLWTSAAKIHHLQVKETSLISSIIFCGDTKKKKMFSNIVFKETKRKEKKKKWYVGWDKSCSAAFYFEP